MKSKAGISGTGIWRLVIGSLTACLVTISIYKLEATREGLSIQKLDGTTPATLYSGPGEHRPLIIVSHGFAGSRQLMQAISLTLARAGYDALAFDFEGHGRNPMPMRGDIKSIDGTTRRLIDETKRVIAAGLKATGWQGSVGLIGHSMASDIVIRTAIENKGIGPVIAISMYSEAVTAAEPKKLLMISGQFETRLLAVALERLKMIAPGAQAGETVENAGVTRRAAVAPYAEHVGVLFSNTTLDEIRNWLDLYYDRKSSPSENALIGNWIALLLAALPALAWSLSGLLPQRGTAAVKVPVKAFASACLIPALLTPMIATQIDLTFLPILTADYLALHLLLLGAGQLLLLWWLSGVKPVGFQPLYAAALVFFAIGVFGMALDRYFSNFILTPSRLPIFLAILPGTLLFMLADATLTEGGNAPFWRRILLRLVLFGSLAIAIALDPERLFFLAIIFPVLVLFFIIYGLMGRWTAARSGPATPGFALGIVLAWSLAATFPLFSG